MRFHVDPAAPRPRNTYTLGLAVFLVLALGTAHLVPFAELPTLCLLRRLTDLPCPGCGLTRSWVLLAHGEFVAAFLQSPVGAAGAVALAALTAYRTGRAAGLPGIRLPSHGVPRWLLWMLGFGGLLLHWLYLLMSGVAG